MIPRIPETSGRRTLLTRAVLPGLGLLLAALPPALPPASAQDPADEELRVFEADLGPAWIDTSAYPEEQRLAYELFSRRCSKCHTLARPINSTLKGDDWVAYVTRMSRKPGSGISPGDKETIISFLIFDSERRERGGDVVDPELLPFLRVSEELAGVRRFPASLKDIRPRDGEVRVTVEGDRRLDLSRLFAKDDDQQLVKWSRREPNRGELVVVDEAGGGDGGADPVGAGFDPGLLAVVDEAVGSETDPEERVELLLDWMDESIVREYRAGLTDALTVLGDRRGDATELTRVFVALARAAGLPAREQLGFVARRTAFYLHPWAEVWIDGWISVDPYLGQFPADATHLRLSALENGALESWDAGSVPGLDRLELRVVLPDDDEAESEG